MDAPVHHREKEWDGIEIQKMLDRARAQIFIGKSSAFYGSLLCSTEWIWATDEPTAWTDGLTIWCNPHWFMEQHPDTRAGVIRHELEHIARLHMLRQGSRNNKLWNYACDYRINNDMEDEGIFFKGFKPYVDRARFPRDMSEEQIYEELLKDATFVPMFGWGEKGDMGPGPDEEGKARPLPKVEDVVEKVAQARAHSVMAKGAGELPAFLAQVLNQFISAKVPWQQYVQAWLTDKQHNGRTWRRPNRRYSHIYMPSKYVDDGRLAHVIFYLDVSGSISQKEAVQFVSEFQYVHRVFRPEKITLVQFNTQITKSQSWTADDEIDEIEILGSGGTSLECVREHINEHEPTLAVVFSDLECAPMGEPDLPTDMLWIVSNNPGASVEFGTRFDIRT